MKALQIILIALTTFSGCTKKADVTSVTNINSNNQNMNTADTISYLALGDSYTVGESVPQFVSFPYQLTTSLNAKSYPVQYPTIIATTGWTTFQLIAAINRSGLDDKKFSLVTLLIGVNDQFQGSDTTVYKKYFSQVLSMAIALAKDGNKNRVFVLSIPDYGVTPFAQGRDSTIGPQIDQFNAVNKYLSQKAGVNYLDITDISRLAATDPSLIADDGLHPSAKMYMQWVQRLEPLVEAELKK